MLRQVFDQFNKAIKSDIATRSPLADKYLAAAAAQQRYGAYLRAVPLTDFVSKPDLYRTHGIDPEAYSAKVKVDAGGDLAAALGL